jgi:hypothetical protein
MSSYIPVEPWSCDSSSLRSSTKQGNGSSSIVPRCPNSNGTQYVYAPPYILLPPLTKRTPVHNLLGTRGPVRVGTHQTSWRFHQCPWCKTRCSAGCYWEQARTGRWRRERRQERGLDRSQSVDGSGHASAPYRWVSGWS